MRMSAAPHEAAYRPDIDGLRAVAVLSVIGYHAFPGRLSGGFAGVDVFFVISGYLITGIIARALDEGRFTFRDFYARRVRRIFPALLLVLSASLVAGWFLLLPDEYAALAQHVIAGGLFASNLLLASQHGYFDANSDHAPLLHLWSLGVEEQFYIVWPLALFVLWRLRRQPVIWLTLFALLSFAMSIGVLGRDPVAAFYGPLTRVWELAIGGLLALAGLRGDPVQQVLHRWWPAIGATGRGRIGNLLSFGGLLAIIAAMVWLGGGSEFSGWTVLAPTFGAAAVIAAGPRAWPNRVVLSSRLPVAIGLISYPLYLWHWPPLSLVRIIEGVEGRDVMRLRLIRLASVGFALLAAIATYWLVERPLRRGSLARTALGLGGVMGGVLVAAVTVSATQGFAEARGPWGLSLQRADPTPENQFDARCVRDLQGRFVPNFLPDRDFCLADGPDARPSLVTLGDSHAHALHLGLREQVPGAELYGRSTCLPFTGYDGQWRNGIPFQCSPSMDNLLSYVVDRQPSTVVLHGFFMNQFDPRLLRTDPHTLEEDARATFQQLAARVERLVVVLGVPLLPFSPSQCVRRPVGDPRVPCSFPREVYERQRTLYEPQLRAAAAGLSNVVFVDPADAFCRGSECFAALDGKLLYSDEHHLSLYGARAVAAIVRRAF